MRLFQELCSFSTLHAAWKAVKAKNSAGGVDGVSVAEFEKDLSAHLQKLEEELKTGKWSPEPYLRIAIPKKTNEMRMLGLMSVKDKIVQQAIKTLVEYRFERLFLNNSYGYRVGRGAVKAIKRSRQECDVKKNVWVLRLDIDNYFDTIDHTILSARLHSLIPEEEIVRLIMLSVKMGMVSKNMKWTDVQAGVPQGAILSPLLANLYLHSFDQFVVSRTKSYVRYADDFIILCQTEEQARSMLEECSNYLVQRLRLKLNQPSVCEIEKGFEFLGITIWKRRIGLSETKKLELTERIRSLEFSAAGFVGKSLKAWSGICNYYGQLLPQEDLVLLDHELCQTIRLAIEEKYKLFANKNILHQALQSVTFLAEESIRGKKQIVQDCTDLFLEKKGVGKNGHTVAQNKHIIQQRKLEYRKKESENSVLLVNKPGVFIGLTSKGVTVKEKGVLIHQKNISSLTHIVITGKGISLSSNLLTYCMTNKIPIDFFNTGGTHLGSFLSARFIENTLWTKQAQASVFTRHQLALLIISGKLKNQFNLIKYFHKYHKNKHPNLNARFDSLAEWIDKFTKFCKQKHYDQTDFLTQLLGYESQAAIRYWDYIRELLADDKVGFEKREHRGATDIVNSMLNYGYAILYVRVWQALLGAMLNPYESIIHVRQPGKPTFVYDMVELFRSQAVDRVVVSLIQKGIPLQLNSGMLDDVTRTLLAKNVLERLSRYENYRGAEQKLEQIIRLQAREVASFYNNGDTYKPYIAKW